MRTCTLHGTPLYADGNRGLRCMTCLRYELEQDKRELAMAGNYKMMVEALAKKPPAKSV